MKDFDRKYSIIRVLISNFLELWLAFCVCWLLELKNGPGGGLGSRERDKYFLPNRITYLLCNGSSRLVILRSMINGFVSNNHHHHIISLPNQISAEFVGC